MPQTKCVIFPSVSSQISGPGVGIVSRGIHWIVVLMGEKRMGNFASQFFCDGVIAARVSGFDRRGTHDHFGTEGLEKIDLFFRLLVSDRKNHLVAAYRGD